ncbi:RNA-directed DNA polymerase, eukaryota, reverse transcriptase zinc-binding domain protein [Tanacetum coccineum]
MDEMTANMSQYGRGRIGFARVLVEVDARKQFKEGIDVQYKDIKGNIVRTKKIRIEYSWKPSVCEFCKVFGHSHKMCKKMPKSIDEMEQMESGNEREQLSKDKFSEVDKRKQQQNNVSKQNQQANFRRMNYGANIIDSRKTVNVKKFDYKPKVNQNNDKQIEEGMDDNIGNRLNKDHKNEVNFYVDKGIQPTPSETSKWSHLMVTYFEERWEERINKVMTDDDEEDVIEELSGKGIMENEIEGMPWILLGDFNVTLHSHEHSAGSLTISQDMQDFKDRVSINKVNDICSSGFQFTWTKSPSNPAQSILKKLDRVMRNEGFINTFHQAHVVFLSYLIFDHIPSMVIILGGVEKKRKAFRFANYIVEKPNFFNYNYSRMEVKHGGFPNKVSLLRDKVKEWHSKLDTDPFNAEYKIEESKALSEYREALNDEIKLLK